MGGGGSGTANKDVHFVVTKRTEDDFYSILRIVEVRSTAIFLSAQAQFRSQLPAD